MPQSKRTLEIANKQLKEMALTTEESDMIEQVASALDEAMYTLLNDLLLQLKSEIDKEEVLKEVELRYESLGVTVKFLDDRAGALAVMPEQKMPEVNKQLDYYV